SASSTARCRIRCCSSSTRTTAPARSSVADGVEAGETGEARRDMAAGYLYLLIAIVGEVIGTSALKASEGFTRPLPSLVTAVGYGVAFYCLSLTLRTIPVGIAYAIWSGIGIVLISLVGLLAFRQTLDAPALVGIGLILAGVVVINVFSSSVPH